LLAIFLYFDIFRFNYLKSSPRQRRVFDDNAA